MFIYRILQPPSYQSLWLPPSPCRLQTKRKWPKLGNVLLVWFWYLLCVLRYVVFVPLLKFSWANFQVWLMFYWKLTFFDVGHVCDAIVTSNVRCLNLFWYVWKYETHSYKNQTYLGYLIFKFTGVVTTPTPVLQTRLGRRGLNCILLFTFVHKEVHWDPGKIGNFGTKLLPYLYKSKTPQSSNKYIQKFNRFKMAAKMRIFILRIK